MEWTPTEINTYYDNLLVSHIETNFKSDGRVFTPDKLDPMRIILDIEASTLADPWRGRFCEVVDANNVLPFEFTIDYVKLYKLNNSTCNVDINQSNYNFNTYSYGLKKTIVFGQNNCTTCHAKVESGMNISLRATDYIELNDGFEVDNNSFTEFFATVNGDCSN